MSKQPDIDLKKLEEDLNLASIALQEPIKAFCDKIDRAAVNLARVVREMIKQAQKSPSKTDSLKP